MTDTIFAAAFAGLGALNLFVSIWWGPLYGIEGVLWMILSQLTKPR